MAVEKRDGPSFWKKRLLVDVLIAFLIILLPVTLYTHIFIDAGLSGEFIIGNLVIKHGFQNNQALVWFNLSMLLPLLLFIIWFFTSHFVWKYFILSPIGLFLFELLYEGGIIKNSSQNLLPILLSITIFLVSLILLDRRLYGFGVYKIGQDVDTGAPVVKNYKNIYANLLAYKSKLERVQYQTSAQGYLKKLYGALEVLDAEMDFSIKKVKKRKRIRVVFEIISCFILLFIPALFYMEMLIPEGVQFYNLGWIKIGDFGFSDVNMFVWYLNLKLCVLIPLMVWFISCANWWRYSLLVPIILYTYQIWELFQNPSSIKVDQFELIKALPAILFVVGILYIFSHLIKYRYKIYELYLDLTQEINDLVNQLGSTNNMVIEKKVILDQLKDTTISEVTATERMEALLKLKESLISELTQKKEE